MLKIEYVNKMDLQPYVNNAKIHTDEQILQIKKSIEEFGFNDPIAVWKDNEIIEGHGRLLAVMNMENINEVPVIRLDKLTDEQRKAYSLVHNKITMDTYFNMELLEKELSLIENINMSYFGFETADEIADELEGFFEDLPEETKKTKETNDIRFTIKPKDDEIETVIEYLDEKGYDYEEE